MSSRGASYVFDDHLLLHGFFVHACGAAHTAHAAHAWHTWEGHFVFVCVLLMLNESGRGLSKRAVLWFCCRIPTHPVQGNSTFGEAATEGTTTLVQERKTLRKRT